MTKQYLKHNLIKEIQKFSSVDSRVPTDDVDCMLEKVQDDLNRQQFFSKSELDEVKNHSKIFGYVPWFNS